MRRLKTKSLIRNQIWIYLRATNNFMSETNTTTLEPTTTETIKVRKTRTRKQSAPHITALKAAVSKALKNEWLLQNAITKQAKAAERAQAKVAKLTLEARESWYAVQVRCLDCANAHQA